MRDDDKVYYTYANNETELYKIESQINQIKDNEATAGKEKIKNKRYQYEEFNGLSQFYIGETADINTDNVKTRFYFDGDNLIYIKTIIDENTQQLLKLNYSDEINNNLFDIPEEYTEM